MKNLGLTSLYREVEDNYEQIKQNEENDQLKELGYEIDVEEQNAADISGDKGEDGDYDLGE